MYRTDHVESIFQTELYVRSGLLHFVGNLKYASIYLRIIELNLLGIKYLSLNVNNYSQWIL